MCIIGEPAKCLHGKTQHNNENFNSILWSGISKTFFAQLLLKQVRTKPLDFKTREISLSAKFLLNWAPAYTPPEL